jgi:hypothetical protein
MVVLSKRPVRLAAFGELGDLLKREKTKSIAEYGDFQTPLDLAERATNLLVRIGIKARSVIEPTCGQGTFVKAAASAFPEAEVIFGVDINQSHLTVATAATADFPNVTIREGNFFNTDWESLVSSAKAPWLILGNPPWVTSSDLGALESDNLPEKSNFHGRVGIEAITGKSNFDISEWMLLRYLDWLSDSNGTIAVLCKTAVARKILLHLWKKKIGFSEARIYKIDALRNFNAAVDACFFVVAVDAKAHCTECLVFDDIDNDEPSKRIGFRDGHAIWDMSAYRLYRSLLGEDKNYVWRSGIKHDCSKIMELSVDSGVYKNGLEGMVDIEQDFLFPMFKSSDVGNSRSVIRRFMVVPQSFVGEDTNRIKSSSPKTWKYLEKHANYLDRRGSIIYKNKPRFSIFGVGEYSFSPWKIAISGFYKKLQFVRVGPAGGKPVVFDDTIYFLSCKSEAEASFLEGLLRSKEASGFLGSMIYWDDKRPITVDLLRRLDIRKLAALLGRSEEYASFVSMRASSQHELAFAS